MELSIYSKNDIVNSENEILSRLNSYLNFSHSIYYAEKLTEKIKEVCVAKLCDAIGIRCAYNYKNVFFDFFSSIAGEAISQKLNFRLTIDEYNLKFIKFDDVNLVASALTILNMKEIDEAFIDIYELADKYKWVINKLKKFS